MAVILFLYCAMVQGCLTYDSQSIGRWNRDNQRRHRILPFGLSLPALFARRLLAARHVFESELLAAALAASLSPAFPGKRVADLPENLRFWTFDEIKRRFVCLGPSDSRFENVPIDRLMCALSSIPGIYEPFRMGDRVYSDAIAAPGIGGAFRELRSEGGQCLFLSMHRQGRAENTTFIKLHRFRSGRMRVARDLFLFLCRLENHEFVDDLRRGLFEVAALEG